MVAPTIEWLIVGRVMQAAGACSGQVCLRTMTRDLYHPWDGSHVLAKAALFMSFVPITAPIFAGFLVSLYGWRAAFVFLAVLSGILLILVLVLMKETNPALNPRATRLAPMLSAYAEVLRNKTFLAFGLCGVLSYGGIFALLSGAPFVFMRVLHVSPSSYGLIFSISMTGNVAGALLCRKLIPRIHLRGTMLVAGIVAATSGCLQLALAWLGVQHVLAVMVPMWCYSFAHCLNNPCFQAGAVAPFPEKAGSAAAVLGFCMMMAASLVGWWIGKSFDGSLLPLAATMCVVGFLLLANSLTLVQRYGRV
jgi:DHA1 family bicyclomycin/chloramphenicol resistance-like MFS transporter